MNKVVVEGILTYEDGTWVTITVDNLDIQGILKEFTPLHIGTFVRAEGYLVATHMDANKFVITKIEQINKA